MNKAIILTKATSLLYRYNGILKEVIAQKNSYPSEADFLQSWAKYASRVNLLQAIILRN